MGDSKSSSTSTTTQALPGNQQRNVDTLMRAALDYFNSGGRQFFPGDLVADFDPLQTSGQNSIVNFAGGVGSDLVSDAIAANRMFLDPSIMLDPMKTPGFMGNIDAIMRAGTDNLQRSILPSIRGGAISSGQFGGTPAEISEGLAVGEADKNIRDAMSGMFMGQYNQGLNAMLQAQGLAPTMFGLGMAPGQAINAVGEARQGQAQNEIQADVARHEFAQNEPIFLMNLLQQLTGSAGQYGGTTTSTSTQKNSSSPANQILGAGMLAASLWNPMTSLFSGLTGPGLGASLDGLGGSLLGGLGGSLLGGGRLSAFGPMPTGQQRFPIGLGG